MLAHLKMIVVRSLLNWSIISTAVEQKNTPITQGTRTEHGEAGAHRWRHPPHVDTERREPQQQQEREQTCRPHANQAAVGKEIEQLSWLPRGFWDQRRQEVPLQR